MEYQKIIEDLTASYKRLFADQLKNGQIGWAQHKKSNPQEIVSPTIPFIGKSYAGQKTKVLLYASAENLAGYNGHLDDDAMAINRHRDWFEKKSWDFFPRVHIKPVEDGSLLIVLKYICEQLGIDMPATPKEFVESIAFANFGKFSIENGFINKDYAKDKEKLNCSLEYVKADISNLKPDIIIMFESIYSTEKNKIDSIKGDARIIRTYQINAQTVNRLINKKYLPKDINKLSATIRDWYDIKHFHENKFTNKTHKNFLSVFTYLDTILK